MKYESIKFVYDRSRRLPKYLQLADAIAEWLELQSLPPGTRLPSNRRLAVKFNISSLTVNRSLTELARRGIIMRRSGSGTYVAEMPREGTIRIGLVCHEPISVGDDSYMGPLIRHLGHEADSGGIDLLQLIRHPRNYERTVNEFGLSGLIVIDPHPDFVPYMLELERAAIPFVTIGVRLPELAGHAFGTDHRRIAADTVAYLAARGHRRIAVMLYRHRADILPPSSIERREGCAAGMWNAGLPVNPEWIIEGKPGDRAYVERRLLRLAGSGEMPTALMIAQQTDVIPTYTILQKMELRIPENVSLIAFDDPEYAVHLRPPLTAWRQDVASIAAQAVGQLLNRISRRKCRDFTGGAVLMERCSVAAADGRGDTHENNK